MSELYENLLNHYKNRSFWIDSNNLKGVILFNEDPYTIKKMLITFKYNQPEHKFCIIEFVKDALIKGFDWKLYGQPEWEALKPKKRNKFIRPNIRKVTTNIPTPRELVNAAIKKHLQPSKMYDILDEMARTIALVPDPLRREVYVKSLSDEFKFDIETLRNQVNYKRKINERQA